MTYRDNKDALQARVEALRNQKADAAREHAELSGELAEAELELRAVREEAAQVVAPPWMLAVGVVGTAFAGLRSIAWFISPLWPNWVNMVAGIAATVAIGVGLLGLARHAGSKLLQAAGWVSIFEAFAMVASYFFSVFGAWSSTFSPAWCVYIASDVVLGMAMLRGGFAPHGLRKACGVLRLVQGGMSTVSMLALWSGATSAVSTLYSLRAPSILHAATVITLALVFVHVYRALSGRARG